MDDGERGRWRPQVLPGGGERRAPESLVSRDAVARVLVGAAADLLLRRIDAARAHSIRSQVERVLLLFDRVEDGAASPVQLASEISALEGLVDRRRERARGVAPHGV